MSKCKLPFINNGKEFEVPKMTVEAHEKAMDDMVQYGKLNEEKYNRLFNKHLMVGQLKKIDDKVKIEDIENMHPDEYIDLFKMIWDSGRARKSDSKFRL